MEVDCGLPSFIVRLANDSEVNSLQEATDGDRDKSHSCLSPHPVVRIAFYWHPDDFLSFSTHTGEPQHAFAFPALISPGLWSLCGRHRHRISSQPLILICGKSRGPVVSGSHPPPQAEVAAKTGSNHPHTKTETAGKRAEEKVPLLLPWMTQLPISIINLVFQDKTTDFTRAERALL
ncbi:hypothetical protein ACRRTK_008388 [Alexandromys fortis]